MRPGGTKDGVSGVSGSESEAAKVVLVVTGSIRESTSIAATPARAAHTTVNKVSLLQCEQAGFG